MQNEISPVPMPTPLFLVKEIVDKRSRLGRNALLNSYKYDCPLMYDQLMRYWPGLKELAPLPEVLVAKNEPAELIDGRHERRCVRRRLALPCSKEACHEWRMESR